MRKLHQLYACLMGYFWLSCPVCGRDFGGHEWAASNTVWTGSGTGQAVCSRACRRVGRTERIDFTLEEIYASREKR